MKNVLLIEDDPALRENTAELLELSDYKVMTASNGKVGVNLATQHLPDIIVCDIMMPELDGYGVLESLSNQSQTKNIPFIFLSAKTERKDVRKGMDMGADDYLTKPFEEEELISAIESRLAKTAILREQSAVSSITDSSLSSLEDLRKFFRDHGDLEHYDEGETIYEEGKHSNYTYLLVKGVVKNHRIDEHGKELITGLHKSDDLFGYASFVDSSPYAESASVIESAEVFRVSKKTLRAFLVDHHHLTLELVNYMADNLSELKGQLVEMAYNSVRKKTASTILKFVDKLKQEETHRIKISRSDLASVAGIATESLIRALSSLKKEGLIDIKGRSIEVLDEVALSEVE